MPAQEHWLRLFMKTDEDAALEKKKIRAIIKNLLEGLPLRDHKLKSSIITGSLLNSGEYNCAHSVFVYYPFRKEIDTRVIIKDALAKNKKIILPKVSGSELKIFFVNDELKDLRRSNFDILEPDETICSEAPVDIIDLVIVPGLCFDLNFNRLGYGGGFYDKILGKFSSRARKIALAFDLQILDNIPSCPHDQKVDIIITESNIYRDIAIDRAKY